VQQNITSTDFCQARQIDQRQAEHVGREDFQVDGLSIDALVISCYSRRFVLNLASDLGEVVKLASRHVEELAPFLLFGCACGCLWHVDLFLLVFVAVAGEVDELENERTAGDDAVSSWEKVSTDNVL